MEVTTPEAWNAVLDLSQAQIAAGETVPLLPVLDRLRATAERLEAELGRGEDDPAPNTGQTAAE